jgi:hypothetical protein
LDFKEPEMKGDGLYGRPTDRDTDSDLATRIRAEFAEMPGLKLTLPQASRLFNVERVRCERILERLVTHGDLSTRDGSFLGVGVVSGEAAGCD